MNEKRHGGRGGHSGHRGRKHGQDGLDTAGDVTGEGGKGPGRHRHGHRGGGRRGGRLFDYGELRLLILALIADGPSHGYELIKTIEDRFAGAYSPSPGVIYPTLSWLEDMGYAVVDPQEGGRKLYRITKDGAEFLKLKKQEADGLFARAGQSGGPPGYVPAPVIRAMENLKTALRLRLRQGEMNENTIDAIAAAIDAAAQNVEKCE
ncbi:PadR family transcriptional regulator [Hwanghaeella sp.]|uniref:PadR family transcriptional regulator n=1 Tax=Hwanghaeella sp. TaxID=2605943 RepID=UPI003CCBC811